VHICVGQVQEIVPAVDDKRRPDVSEIQSSFVYENWHTLQQAFASETPGNKKQMQQRADTSATTDNNDELITTEYSCTSVLLVFLINFVVTSISTLHQRGLIQNADTFTFGLILITFRHISVKCTYNIVFRTTGIFDGNFK